VSEKQHMNASEKSIPPAIWGLIHAYIHCIILCVRLGSNGK